MGGGVGAGKGWEWDARAGESAPKRGSNSYLGTNYDG
jgi:hypothetical protein